jgi:hypothetical protein
MTPTNHPAPAWQQTLLECRDFIADCVGHGGLSARELVNAEELIADTDAILSRRGEPVAWREALKQIAGVEPSNDRRLHLMQLAAMKQIAFVALAASPPTPALDARTVEACARELETRYPGHTWVNAYCAAIRSLALRADRGK